MAQSATVRTVPVHFYRAVPRDEQQVIHFDFVRSLEQIDALEAESGQAYLPKGLYEQMLCTVHGETKAQMLVGWTINRETAVFLERKGEITELDLLDDEGVADPAYSMFFPDDVLGVIRPTSRSPGAAFLAEYIEHFTDATNLSFAPLIDAAVLRKLQRPAEDVVNVYMRIRRENLGGVRDADAELFSVLEQAGGAFGGSTEVRLGLRVTRMKDKAPWWTRVRPMLRRLVQSGAVDEFATLSVKMRDGTIQLLREHITCQAPGSLGANMTLRPESALEALLWAYERKRDDIHEALTVEFPG